MKRGATLVLFMILGLSIMLVGCATDDSPSEESGVLEESGIEAEKGEPTIVGVWSAIEAHNNFVNTELEWNELPVHNSVFMFRKIAFTKNSFCSDDNVVKDDFKYYYTNCNNLHNYKIEGDTIRLIDIEEGIFKYKFIGDNLELTYETLVQGQFKPLMKITYERTKFDSLQSACVSAVNKKFSVGITKGQIRVGFEEGVTFEEAEKFINSAYPELSLEPSHRGMGIVRVPEKSEVEWACKLREEEIFQYSEL